LICWYQLKKVANVCRKSRYTKSNHQKFTLLGFAWPVFLMMEVIAGRAAGNNSFILYWWYSRRISTYILFL